VAKGIGRENTQWLKYTELCVCSSRYGTTRVGPTSTCQHKVTLLRQVSQLASVERYLLCQRRHTRKEVEIGQKTLFDPLSKATISVYSYTPMRPPDWSKIQSVRSLVNSRFLSDKIGQTANSYHRPSMNHQVTNPEVRLGAATVGSATSVDRNLLMRA
jgi:hypothetical protein